MGEGNFRIIQIDLPRELVEQFHYWSNLDNIGPAYFAELERLEDILLTLIEAPK